MNTSTRTDAQEMRHQMIGSVREMLGDGYVDDFYEQNAGDFIRTAEWYAETLVAAATAKPEGVKTWEVDEPIEIDLVSKGNGVLHYTLLAGVRNGVVWTQLTPPGSTQTWATDTIQPRDSRLPRKAVAGWQDELIAYAASGLYEIGRFR